MAMSEEQKTELEKVDKKIKLFTNLRLGILLIALLDVLVIYYGDKLAEGASWLLVFKAYSYNILGIALFFILITIIIRMFLVAKHNRIVRQSRD
jgi:hypothetical protein